MFKLSFTPFLNADGGAEGGATGADSVSAAETQASTTEGADGGQTGANEGAADPTQQNNFEKAFSKRLAAKEQEWQANKAKEIEALQSQYKDYDHYKKAADYLQRSAGMDSILSLTEQIELIDLQDRADRENMPVAAVKRMDELEKKAQGYDEMMGKFSEQQTYQTFRTGLEKFAGEKGADADALHAFMYENQIANPEIAYRAFIAGELETKLTSAKEDAVKEYLASKQAPRVGSSGAAATQSVDTSKMSWAEIDRVAAARIRANKNPV